MSEINGTGYGSVHDWENRGTEQMPAPEGRSTLFMCRKCKCYFRHWYHIEPDIFAAMKEQNIPEECNYISNAEENTLK